MIFDIFTIALIFSAGFCAGVSFLALFVSHTERETEPIITDDEGGEWYD